MHADVLTPARLVFHDPVADAFFANEAADNDFLADCPTVRMRLDLDELFPESPTLETRRPAPPAVAPPPPEPLPWDRRFDLASFRATWARVLAAPGAWIPQLDAPGAPHQPLSWLLLHYGAAAVVVQTLARADAALGGGGPSLPVALAVTPLLAVLAVGGAWLRAMALHLGLRLTGDARRPRLDTLRATAYAGGALALFSVAPVIGPAVVAWRELQAGATLHGVSTRRALLALVVGSLFLVAAVAATLAGALALLRVWS